MIERKLELPVLKSVYSSFAKIFTGLPGTDFKQLIESLEESLDNLSLKEDFKKIESNDDLAAEHYHVFGMGVFPFGHYFLSPVGNFGGEEEDLVIAIYNKYDFDFVNLDGGMGPTHLGTLLHFCAHLIENSQTEDADYHELSALRRTFIAGQILTWLPTLSFAIKDLKSPLFEKLLDLALSIAYSDWKALNGPEFKGDLEFQLPQWDVEKDFLEIRETGLRDIAENLVTPAFSGMFLSKSTMKSLVSESDIPMGFGERKNLMENILKESVRYEDFKNLIDRFENLTSRWKDFYNSFPEDLAPVKSQWLRALGYSEVIFEKLKNTPPL